MRACVLCHVRMCICVHVCARTHAREYVLCQCVCVMWALVRVRVRVRVSVCVCVYCACARALVRVCLCVSCRCVGQLSSPHFILLARMSDARARTHAQTHAQASVLDDRIFQPANT